jgi:hypothetical protein
VPLHQRSNSGLLPMLDEAGQQLSIGQTAIALPKGGSGSASRSFSAPGVTLAIQ